jgi:hypothetical protein
VLAIAFAALATLSIVEGVRTYRRLRDEREARGRDAAPGR